MLLSICIPHYNRWRHLLVVLESIRRQDYPHLEVIVSDDCSTDESEQKIQGYLERVRSDSPIAFTYIRQPSNLGYDANLRASMEAASGDYLFILGNDDALPGPDVMSRLAVRFSAVTIRW